MIACHAAELAPEILLFPKCLDIDEVVAPPIAPADIICITDKNGKTYTFTGNKGDLSREQTIQNALDAIYGDI